MGWASWSFWAPWELFNWQVGEEETSCLVVVWRPVPLKDLSSNLRRAFSSKWVVACKELTNFPLDGPRHKKESLLLEPPHMILLKALTLSFKSFTFSMWGISGKLIGGTKVVTPVRSLFCNVALLAAWLVVWFPHAPSMLPLWCPLQWETEISAGRWTAFKSLRIWSPYLIGDLQVVKWPLSFQIAACACSTRKAYLESV